jgi:hypothetical protein
MENTLAFKLTMGPVTSWPEIRTKRVSFPCNLVIRRDSLATVPRAHPVPAADKASKVFSRAFVRALLGRFDSEDVRERDYLKNSASTDVISCNNHALDKS